MKKYIYLIICLLFTVISGGVAYGLNADLKAFADGHKSKFSTKGHSKAKGINISVEYPSHWKLREGERPNIVQKFLGDASDGVTRMFLILINNTPKELSALSGEDLSMESFSEKDLKDMVPAGGTYLDGGITKYDGQSGSWMIYSMDVEQAGMAVRLYTLQHMFFYGGKVVSVQCMIGGLRKFDASLHQEFTAYLPLFQQIGNSVIVHDKWAKPVADKQSPVNTEASAIDSVFGATWWVTIIISFVLTWGIGLTPPLLIRYMILRRPLSKAWAVGVVVTLWFINFIVFTLLDSKSKTHAALFLVAWVSYIILKKEKKPENPTWQR